MTKIPSAHLSEILNLSTLTLATASPECEPSSAPVYFAAGQDLRLYFFSDPGSQHSRNTAQNPQAAAAIYPEVHDWRDIRGLQLRGRVRVVEPGLEWEAAWELYTAKFPFVSELRAVVASNTLYVFEPRWVRLVDNRRGFGFKEEWELRVP